MAKKHTFGDDIGAHQNPTVSLGLAVERRSAWSHFPGYIGAKLHRA
ncbi:hypothetical protein BH11VER1_BH11VER1_02670 [soil metagenome]